MFLQLIHIYVFSFYFVHLLPEYTPEKKEIKEANIWGSRSSFHLTTSPDPVRKIVILPVSYSHGIIDGSILSEPLKAGLHLTFQFGPFNCSLNMVSKMGFVKDTACFFEFLNHFPSHCGKGNQGPSGMNGIELIYANY